MTWSQPGDTSPYAALDARIADAKRERDGYVVATEDLAHLQSRIQHLEVRRRALAGPLPISARILDAVDAAKRRFGARATAPSRRAVRDHQHELVQDEIDELTVSRDEVRETTYALRRGPERLRTLLRSKAELVVDHSREGWTAIDELTRQHAELLDTRRRFEEALTSVRALHYLAWDTRREWQWVADSMYPPEVWNLWRAPITARESRLSKVFGAPKQHRDRLAERMAAYGAVIAQFGLPALIEWPFDETLVTQSVTDHLGHLEARLFRDIRVLEQSAPQIEESLAGLDVELERILSRPY